uniref:hypothetical protein n=1 Tax=Bordetella sputigena TaxID=1416810 RepID=UPI0039F003F7
METAVLPARTRIDTAMGDTFADYRPSSPTRADGADTPTGCGWLPRSNGARLSGKGSGVASRRATADDPAKDAVHGGSGNSARTRPCQVQGVDEFFKVVAKWSKTDPAVGRLAQQIYMNNRIDSDAAELLGRVVSEWKARGVFEPLMERVMARYERDGTLAATVDRLMAGDPGKNRAAAEQEARAQLRRWDSDPKAAAARFDLLLDPDSDLEKDAADDSAWALRR